jgi:hypothetical protein
MSADSSQSVLQAMPGANAHSADATTNVRSAFNMHPSSAR